MRCCCASSLGLRRSRTTASTTYRPRPIKTPPSPGCPLCPETSVRYLVKPHTSFGTESTSVVVPDSPLALESASLAVLVERREESGRVALSVLEPVHAPLP